MKVGLIECNDFGDERAVVWFANDFDMSAIVRMYCIESKMGLLRAWHGHKV